MEVSEDFRNAYIRSDREYRLIKEVVQMRKESGISQSIITKQSGLKQQVI